ncbi:hypothetical protein Tdes44962_MAKER08089 [Teratosphaeria destructans]|uniref:Histone-lysine N-methyltransferase NSD-like PHD zinc finger domain-containing protein n=1 Tax=Teratosphaeria destructans TaxID=418781 RepID=A0A9W7SXI7_9PEZI|nr:hypothetical protein Tdes44962_MAKER08089 [Teratosphaeria destructans]
MGNEISSEELARIQREAYEDTLARIRTRAQGERESKDSQRKDSTDVEAKISEDFADPTEAVKPSRKRKRRATSPKEHKKASSLEHKPRLQSTSRRAPPQQETNPSSEVIEISSDDSSDDDNGTPDVQFIAEFSGAGFRDTSTCYMCMDDEDESEVITCSNTRCGKCTHRSCLTQWAKALAKQQGRESPVVAQVLMCPASCGNTIRI